MHQNHSAALVGNDAKDTAESLTEMYPGEIPLLSVRDRANGFSYPPAFMRP